MIIKKKRSQDNTENIEAQVQPKAAEPAPDDEIFSKFSIDNINFEQRPERRQGSRRRGYRRIDDRNLVSRAQEEAISIKEKAAQEGHKIGIEMAQEDISKLNDALEEFFTYKTKVYDEVAGGILDISLEIAKKILNIELDTNKQALLNIINNALSTHSKGENHVTIRVLPTEVETVKENIPEILSNGQFEAKIVVVGDDTIEMGGAIIETNNGIIDATVGTQLEIIKEALIKSKG